MVLALSCWFCPFVHVGAINICCGQDWSNFLQKRAGLVRIPSGVGGNGMNTVLCTPLPHTLFTVWVRYTLKNNNLF